MKKLAVSLISLALVLLMAVPAFAAAPIVSPVNEGLIDDAYTIANDSYAVGENNSRESLSVGALSVDEERMLLGADLRELMGSDYDPDVEWVIIPLANIQSRTARTGKTTLVITVKGLAKDSKIGVLHQRSTDKKLEFIKGVFDTNTVKVEVESLSPFALVVDPVTAAAVLAQNFNSSDLKFFSPNTFDASYVVAASVAAVVCIAGAAVAVKKSKED